MNVIVVKGWIRRWNISSRTPSYSCEGSDMVPSRNGFDWATDWNTRLLFKMDWSNGTSWQISRWCSSLYVFCEFYKLVICMLMIVVSMLLHMPQVYVMGMMFLVWSITAKKWAPTALFWSRHYNTVSKYTQNIWTSSGWRRYPCLLLLQNKTKGKYDWMFELWGMGSLEMWLFSVNKKLEKAELFMVVQKLYISACNCMIHFCFRCILLMLVLEWMM